MVSERGEFFFELGFSAVRGADGELIGSAAVVPEMCLPGTRVLRMSVLATFVDMLSGLLAVAAFTPRIPVTLQLDLHLRRIPVDLARAELVARPVKSGRSVFAAEVELNDESGRAIGFATGTFMVVPDPSVVFPPGPDPLEQLASATGRLSQPFPDSVGLELGGPGMAHLPMRERSLNASGTLNGGLLALVAEEAALSGRPGAVLAMMNLQYLSPVRVGPAVAQAVVSESPGGALGRVTVVDEGRNGSVAVLVTTRAFPARL